MTKAIVHMDSFVIMLKFFIIKSGEKRCFEHLFYAKYIHTDIKEKLHTKESENEANDIKVDG